MGGSAARLATFFCPDAPEAGRALTLGDDAARHARVLRLQNGEAVALTDGSGHRATARVTHLGRDYLDVLVLETTEAVSRPDLHLLAPVADKDRTFWLAEKAVELGAASWRPVMWSRSRSVNTRASGSGYQRRLEARMISAMCQCGGAWLPAIFPECGVDRAIAAAPNGSRLLLAEDAQHPFPVTLAGCVVLAVGPEGGMEEREVSAFSAAGFVRVRIPGNTLRFETAGVAALALARVALESGSSNVK